MVEEPQNEKGFQFKKKVGCSVFVLYRGREGKRGDGLIERGG